MKMLSVRSAEGRGCRRNSVLQTAVCGSLAVIFIPLWIAELFPLDGPQSPDCVRDGLLLRVSICALHQRLRPLKHGCFCGIHVVPTSAGLVQEVQLQIRVASVGISFSGMLRCGRQSSAASVRVFKKRSSASFHQKSWLWAQQHLPAGVFLARKTAKDIFCSPRTSLYCPY